MDGESPSDPGSYVATGLKFLVVVVAGYVAMVMGNGLGALLVSAIHPHGVGVVGAAFDGLVVGCLTALLIRRGARIVCSPLLASLPILFSWFVRHAHTTTLKYVNQGGRLIPLGTAKPVYADLIIMLLVAGAASILMVVLLRRKSAGE